MIQEQVKIWPVRDFMSKLGDMHRIHHGGNPDWAAEVPKAGYHLVVLQHQYWKEAHEWCKEVCGEDHYCWSGTNFFFTYEKDAQMFRLCYGVV